MNKLEAIVEHAIADWGIRQTVMWAPREIITRRHLSDAEASILREIIGPELEALPVPVEPQDRLAQGSRLAKLIRQAQDG